MLNPRARRGHFSVCSLSALARVSVLEYRLPYILTHSAHPAELHFGPVSYMFLKFGSSQSRNLGHTGFTALISHPRIH